jgi:hypothetical protein
VTLYPGCMIKFPSQWSSFDDSDQDLQIVSLNIGGTIFQTYITTLTNKINDKSHFFHNLFTQNKLKISKDTKGCVFIDRSAIHFHYILDYLKNQGKIQYCHLPTSDLDLIRQIKHESDFYGLTDLKDYCKNLLYRLYLENNVFPDSKWSHSCKSDSHYNCYRECNSNEISPQFIQDVDDENHHKYYIYQFKMNHTGQYSNYTFLVGLYHDVFCQFSQSFPKTGDGCVTLWIDVLNQSLKWFDEEKLVHEMKFIFDRRIRIFIRHGVSKEIEFVHEGVHPLDQTECVEKLDK